MIVNEMDLTGKNLSNYKIVGKLGKGGMATVYKAHELSLNRMVALKVLSPQLSEEVDYIKRFQREAQAAAQLNHPNIVQIYAIGEESGVYYFAMELIKGKSLAQVKQEEGKMAPEKAALIIRQVADALAEAHKADLVHRDIKPSNIMIDSAGRAKVTDFGIAYITHAQTKLTKDGSIIGTPEYLSPEQCEGKTVDQRSDIYSLGVTLYELLSGRTPYEADTPVSMLMKIVKGEFPPLQEICPDVPKPLQEIVNKMMQKNVQDRYQQMDEVVQALGEIDSGVKAPSTMVVEEAHAEPVAVERKSNKWAAVIVAAVIVILMGGAFAAKMLYFDKKDTASSAPAPLLSTTSAGEQTSPATADTQPTGSETQPAEGSEGTESQEGMTESQEGTDQETAADTDTDTTLAASTEQPPSGEQSDTSGQSPESTTPSVSAITPRAATKPGTTKPITPIKPLPPVKSCLITAIGDDDKADLVAPYIEEILAKKKYTVIDGPSIPGGRIADVARNHIVVSVKQTGSTTLQYYGKSSEMYTVRLTMKVVDPHSGKVLIGPLNQTVEYTALNSEEKLKEAVISLMSRILPLLENQSR